MWEVRTDKHVYASFQSGIDAVQFMINRGLSYNQGFYLKQSKKPMTLIRVNNEMKAVIARTIIQQEQREANA